MADILELLTDDETERLQQEIENVYQDAAYDVGTMAAEYFRDFVARDEAMKARLEADEITTEYYRQWRLNQIGRGERFQTLRDTIAERITEANELAIEIINGYTPGIYALGRNTERYKLENLFGAAYPGQPIPTFSIWNEAAVNRIIKTRPDLMPHYPEARALQRGIDLEYGKRQVTNIVGRNLVSGKSVRETATDLMNRITGMNRASAMRAARTATVGALNAGREDSMNQFAEDTGVEVLKEWVCIGDSRSRDTHIHLDGVQVRSDEAFPNGLKYPGDPAGLPEEVYNCRCSMRSILPASRKYHPPKESVAEYSKWLRGHRYEQ